MSSLTLSGDTSGSVTLAVPAVSGSNTITYPAATGNGSINILSTAVATTSGTTIDFTGLPSWIKRVTVVFNGVSTNGVSQILVRLGYGSTTYVTSGYSGGGAYIINNGSAGNYVTTDGFSLGSYAAVAATLYNGTMTLINISGNVWVYSSSMGGPSNVFGAVGGGNVTLSDTLTAIRLTTSNGTDTFDAGSVNILYEG